MPSEQAENFQRVRGAMPEDERRIRDEEIAKIQEIARAYRASDLLLRERKLLTFGTQIMDAVLHLRDERMPCAKSFARATATFWSTNFRTPTSRNSNCSGCSAASGPTWSWWATIARPFTVFAARRSAASRFF